MLKALLINYAHQSGVEIAATEVFDILRFEMDSNLAKNIAMIEGEEFPTYERFENAYSYSMQYLSKLILDTSTNKFILENTIEYQSKSQEFSELVQAVNEVSASLKYRIEIQYTWFRNFLDLIYENFYGTYLRLDNFIIDVIFKEYNNMSELKKEFEDAIE